MGAFLLIIGFLLFAGSILWLIVQLFRKKPLKKVGYSILVGAIMFIVGVVMLPPSESDTAQTDKEPAEVAAEGNDEEKSDSTEEDAEADKSESSEQAHEDEKPIVLEPQPNDLLKDYVTTFDGPVVEYNEQEIKLIGADFGKQGVPGITGIKDVDAGYVGSFSFLQGFNQDSKRDAELVLYFELISTQEINPRSEIMAKLPEITVEDDQGEEAKEIARVPNDTLEVYYRVDENVVGAIGFAVYSDSQEFIISIEDQKFKLDGIPYRIEEEY